MRSDDETFIQNSNEKLEFEGNYSFLILIKKHLTAFENSFFLHNSHFLGNLLNKSWYCLMFSLSFFLNCIAIVLS